MSHNIKNIIIVILLCTIVSQNFDKIGESIKQAPCAMGNCGGSK